MHDNSFPRLQRLVRRERVSTTVKERCRLRYKNLHLRLLGVPVVCHTVTGTSDGIRNILTVNQADPKQATLVYAKRENLCH